MTPMRTLALLLAPALLLAACSSAAVEHRDAEEPAPAPALPREATPAPSAAATGSPVAADSPPAPAPAAEEAPRPLYWANTSASSLPIYERTERTEEYVGTLREGFPFPVWETAPGPDCRGEWARVGPRGWVCSGSLTRLEAEPPPPPDDPLPFRYANVFKDSEIHSGPSRQLKTGKTRKRKAILSILEEQGGWMRAYPDEWLDKRNLILRPPYSSSLVGEPLREPLAQPFAFVRYNHVVAFPEPARTDADRRRMPKKVRTPVKRFSRHPVLAVWPEGDMDRADWVQLPDGWIEHWRLGIVKTEPRPSAIPEGEKWILVDLSEQTLTAYEGDTPVFATVVSTGRDEEDKRTPTGIYRITNKLRSARMSGGTGDDYHYVSDVPWVQYFNGGVALHGVYWHNAMGWPISNGCVNLTPADARWLFHWTDAPMPPGWYSLMTDSQRPGSWVVVRQ